MYANINGLSGQTEQDLQQVNLGEARRGYKRLIAVSGTQLQRWQTVQASSIDGWMRGLVFAQIQGDKSDILEILERLQNTDQNINISKVFVASAQMPPQFGDQYFLKLYATIYGQTASGDSLLDKTIDIMNPESSKATLVQTIQTTSGQTRTLKYKSYSAGEGKYNLMRYLEPARVRGNAMMMKNYANDIWMYNRRTRRVRKLASHAKRQNFEGSDFTYEDMGTGDTWKKDYNPENLGKVEYQNTACYKLKCVPKENADAGYSKVILWIRTSDCYPLKIDYYQNGDLLKTLYLEDLENIAGQPTAKKMIMKNVQENTQTIMAYEDITYNVDLDENFFCERRLRR